MTERTKPSSNSVKPVPTSLLDLAPLEAPNRGKFYRLLWLGLNSALWSGAVLFLTVKPPSYASKWTINVPVSENSSNVNIPGIGQAYSASDSPYKSFADPREIYSHLMQSKEVIKLAATKLNLSTKAFRRPRIKIVDNTTLIEVEIKGASPEQAQEKAIALQTALETKLAELQRAELTQRDRNLTTALRSDQQRLQTAEEQLARFRQSSTLSSTNQLDNLTSNLETLRRSKAEAIAELQQIDAKFDQLAANLGLSASEAADALVLQSDQVFQRYLANYSQASAEIDTLGVRFTPSTPHVQAKQQEIDTAQTSMLQRAELLLERSISPALIGRATIAKGSSTHSTSEQAGLFE
ncbi:hypothetical protein IQ250_16290, partial [Pseudanabaenaceae cyanobacterium LEGE 13415]|nr:hypothetical protein [Pseudanabaenaceae cyanobacterium LEGE 13415]